MKKTCLILLFNSVLFCYGQDKMFFKSDSMVWFGLDFTKAKFTGHFAIESGLEINSVKELVNKDMPGWNDIILKEPLHYDIGHPMKKPIFFSDLSSITKLNSEITAADSIYYEQKAPYKIYDPDKTIPAMVSNYKSDKYPKGLGCSFIVESYNQAAHDAYVYFVLFDIETKKVWGFKRIKGFPKGIGLRNYWSGAIKDIIKQLGSNYGSIEYQTLKAKK